MSVSLQDNDLPVIIGKISDSWNDTDGKVWEYGDLVQHAQEQFVRSEDRTAIVRRTRYYDYSDRWHYNSEGYIDLGKNFAGNFKEIDKLLLYIRCNFS